MRRLINFFIFQPKLIIKEGIHPFIPIDDFVPNDTILGGPKQPILILSGPNMGGKSTLMRQVGIIAIMAQLVKFKIVNSRNEIIFIHFRVFTFLHNTAS